MDNVITLNTRLNSPRARREKIWELEKSFHCSLIGTCVSMRELHKIARKANVSFRDGADDHAIHAAFVRSVGTASPIARLLNRAPEKKYRASIEKCKRLKTLDELAAFWNSAREAGDIPGPYWAVMLHPDCEDSLRAALFGDVHMLSHLVGAANRADIRRLKALEEERDKYATAFDAERARATRIINEREHEVAGLTAKLAERTDTIERAAKLAERLARLESGQVVREMSESLEQAAQTAKSEHQKAVDTELILATRDGEIAALSDELNTLRDEITVVCAERDALERSLESSLGEICSRCSANNPAPAPDHLSLDGASIVYVGGRTAQIGHFRAVVEKAGGRFLHHDGGLEDGAERLEGALVKGDVVLCPIDCVSHSACLRAKNFCKRTGKSFVPLRSSGLSSFVSGLQDISLPS